MVGDSEWMCRRRGTRDAFGIVNFGLGRTIAWRIPRMFMSVDLMSYCGWSAGSAEDPEFGAGARAGVRGHRTYPGQKLPDAASWTRTRFPSEEKCHIGNFVGELAAPQFSRT